MNDDAARHAQAIRRGALKWRLRARLRYLWRDAPTDWVELLSASLSATFAVVLAYQGHRASILAHAYWYAALCAVAAACKVVGVLGEVRALRVVGLLLGTFFWLTFSVALVRAVPDSLSWLCFLVLALAQGWVFWRLRRERR